MKIVDCLIWMSKCFMKKYEIFFCHGCFKNKIIFVDSPIVHIMFKTRFITTLLLSCIALCSCNQSENEIRNATKMIDHAEQSDGKLSKSEMDQLGSTIDMLQKKLDDKRSEYSDEQIKEIGKLQGRYTALVVKNGIHDFKESMKDLGNQLEGFVEGITDSSEIKNN